MGRIFFRQVSAIIGGHHDGRPKPGQQMDLLVSGIEPALLEAQIRQHIILSDYRLDGTGTYLQTDDHLLIPDLFQERLDPSLQLAGILG